MKTPLEILNKFEQAAQGVDYGSITLSLFIKHGQPRYVIAREESFLPANDEHIKHSISAIDKKEKFFM